MRRNCSVLASVVARTVLPRKLFSENFTKLIVIRNLVTFNQLTSDQTSHKLQCRLVHKKSNNGMKMEKNCGNLFSFANYDCIGFDLDNTLVKYNVKNMIYHEYEVLVEFLIAKGYSKEFLLKPIDEEFIQKGLILDFERGNLLRICPDGTIQIASHGTTFLTKQEIIDIYGETKRWEVTDVYCKDMLVAWNGEMAELIRTCLDYFDVPAALAFARIVDSIDLEKGERQKKYTVWPDILQGLISMYDRSLFHTNESKYFEGLKNHPQKFIYKCDQKVLDWLRELKQTKKTFLVTGSHIDFASLTASYALGPDWKNYFDLIVCFSKKPGFFTMNRPFLSLDGIKEADAVTYETMQPGKVYTQGSFSELKRFMSTLCKKEDLRIVYAGDNLIQDVFTPNKHTNLDTIAIVEEMLAEGTDFDQDYEILRSNLWGSYFHTEGNDTLWENIIRKHAKICVPSVDVLASFPLDHQFTSFNPNDNTSCGYHPHDPFDVITK